MIYNRLHAGMTLGIDATLRYGLNIPPTESIRQSQLESNSPYNTRKHAGLPPTPIANPGLASMQAAAHPAKVNYLYFVRKPDKKHHFFTASYKAFQNYANAHGYERSRGSSRCSAIRSASLSPLMQNAAFAARGLDWAYVALRVTPRALEDAVRGLVALGFAGANITTPHKLAVAQLRRGRAAVRQHARRS